MQLSGRWRHRSFNQLGWKNPMRLPFSGIWTTSAEKEDRVLDHPTLMKNPCCPKTAVRPLWGIARMSGRHGSKSCTKEQTAKGN